MLLKDSHAGMELRAIGDQNQGPSAYGGFWRTQGSSFLNRFLPAQSRGMRLNRRLEIVCESWVRAEALEIFKDDKALR